jgi:hypothetical protein
METTHKYLPGQVFFPDWFGGANFCDSGAWGRTLRNKPMLFLNSTNRPPVLYQVELPFIGLPIIRKLVQKHWILIQTGGRF